jgi:hypothetical protein
MPTKPKAKRPREIKGNFYELLHALRALGNVSLTTTSLEELELNKQFSADAFPWDQGEPTRYELSSEGTHLGIAFIK